MIHAWSESLRDSGLGDVLARPQTDMLSELTQLARQFAVNGHPPSGADPTAAGRTLLSMIQGYVVQHHVSGDLTPERYLEGLRGIFR
ncbi:TetR family transcriptional regulator C-terminal domain-containing protein [Embleya sp. MST-111070]|uniref:TetR family transcriptional regulator C-terminal domain-containing protein n=1 Tax=Embleya sp. MST-111070 TaxID=3398231 RepID=UPI003F73C6B6